MKFKYLILLFINVSMVSLTMGQQSENQETLTIEKIWSSRDLSYTSIPGFNFLTDGLHYTRQEDGKINKYNLRSGDKVDVVFDGDKNNGIASFNGEFDRYSYDSNEENVLIEADSESIYRWSTKANYWIYNPSQQVLTKLNQEGKIRNATISPTGKHVAYVKDNNLYFQDLGERKEVAITSDGEINNLINGTTDWVYEEEFGFTKAFFWNEDGTKIGYYKFDESAVQEFTMTLHHNNMYPTYDTFKYPKVGEKNATVSIHVFDLKSRKVIDMDIKKDPEMYIPRIKWTKDPNSLFVFHLNRHQNALDIYAMNAKSGKTKKIINETSKYYVDIHDDLTFLDNGKQFIWSSEKSGFNHLYLYNLNGTLENQITDGSYDVRKFYGFDEKRKELYFQASKESALTKEVYGINLSGKKQRKLTDLPGTNGSQFSPTYDYFVNTNSNINSVPSYAVFSNKEEKVRDIENNESFKKVQEAHNVSTVSFFDFKTSEDVALNGWMIKPPNFDKSKKYPVFMYLYGGPGSQSVSDSWRGNNYWWFQLLAQKGYIVACVDNRGTGGRGEEFKKMTYMQLGHYETIDQIEAATYLGDLPYTDAERIGIFGWSYGGYMSSLCLFKGNEVFKAAIAVAPVTNWKWYDSVYTERYMRTYAENKDGYDLNSPIHFVDQLKGNYLLVHGMADDNVHFQHTAELTKSLIKENKSFDTQFYPNRNHGIYGDNARQHLYQKMTDFILENI